MYNSKNTKRVRKGMNMSGYVKKYGLLLSGPHRVNTPFVEQRFPWLLLQA